MRIVQISHAFHPTFGGVETHLWDVVHGLSERGHAVFCLVGGAERTDVYPSSGPEIRVERRPELSVGHLVGARLSRPVEAAHEGLRDQLLAVVAPRLAALRPDVVHLHNAHHFAPELAQAVLSCARGTPVLNSIHDRVGEHIYPRVLDERWAHVLYASRYLRESLPTVRPASVRHLSVDGAAFTPEGSRSPALDGLERPIVFHPARLLRWKGVLTGVEAFARVATALGRGTLVLCASENTVDDPSELASFRREVEREAAALGIRDRVAFRTFALSDMPAAYRSSDLVWYPTLDDEPLGLVPIEAMSCGRPPVVTRSGGMVETVEDGETGLIVPKGDAGALAGAALRLLGDPALHGRLARAATRAAGRFSPDAYTDWLLGLYGDVARATHAA